MASTTAQSRASSPTNTSAETSFNLHFVSVQDLQFHPDSDDFEEYDGPINTDNPLKACGSGLIRTPLPPVTAESQLADDTSRLHQAYRINSDMISNIKRFPTSQGIRAASKMLYQWYKKSEKEINDAFLKRRSIEQNIEAYCECPAVCPVHPSRCMGSTEDNETDVDTDPCPRCELLDFTGDPENHWLFPRGFDVTWLDESEDHIMKYLLQLRIYRLSAELDIARSAIASS